MGLNIINPEVEKLAAEVASMMGETKTEAIRRALEERRQRLSFQVTNRDRKEKLKNFLEREVWPTVPREFMGKGLSRREEDQLLG
jgi:antitoxin VapB